MIVFATPSAENPSVDGCRPATKCSRVIISLSPLASWPPGTLAALCLKTQKPRRKPPGRGRIESPQLAQDGSAFVTKR
jgi:hypothetical protein